MSNRRELPKLLDWVCYILVRGLAGLLTYLPWKVSRGVADGLCRVFMLAHKQEKKERAVEDVQKAFPGFSRSEAEEVVSGSYRTVFRTVVDGLQFRRHVTTNSWKHLVELRGEELLQECDGDKGIIFASGHFGSWELMGMALGLHGYPVTTVVRPVGSPLLDTYLRALRQAGGQKVVNRHRALRRALRELGAGRHMGFLMDQDARKKGVFVNFMGRPASTQPSVARLSIHTGAPVAFGYACECDDAPRFRVEISDVIWPRPDADEEDEIFRITQRITHDLEQLVRKCPDKAVETALELFDPTE